jgi:hypothetical protein
VEGDAMTAAEIAEQIINGNLTAAREAMVKGQTQQTAALLAVDVFCALAGLDDDVLNGGPDADAYRRLRSTLTGGGW